jgi:hypothetical protein
MKDKSKTHKPSEEFMEAIISGSSAVADCNFCGTTYFDDDEALWTWDERELEELRKKSESSSKYVLVDSVRFGVLDGRQYVDGCPCNAASRYEDVFWDNRYAIVDYFAARTKKELESAQENSKLVKEISDLDF